MLGTSALGELAIGEAARTVELIIGEIDAEKVSMERRVVFEGSKRVVSFQESD
jgi:cytoskeletal protein CcmA (bactofilin family)